MIHMKTTPKTVGTLLPTQLMDVFGDDADMLAVAREVEDGILAMIGEAL